MTLAVWMFEISEFWILLPLRTVISNGLLHMIIILYSDWVSNWGKKNNKNNPCWKRDIKHFG